MSLRNFLLLLGFIVVMRVHAQEDVTPKEWKWIHTVYCSNGSEYRGRILEWKKDTILFEISEGISLDVPLQEVYRVTSREQLGLLYKAPAEQSAKREPRVRDYAFDEKGLYSVATVHSSFQSKFGAGFTHAVGWRFSRMLSAGAGAGMETFEAGAGIHFIPVFAEMRGFLCAKNVSPYYALRAGYGFAKENRDLNADAKGGWMASAEARYRFGGRPGVNFFAGIGFQFQKTMIEDGGFDWYVFEDILYRRTELRVGLIF